MPEKRILLSQIDVPNIQDISVYIERGGYKTLQKAILAMTPDEVIEEVKDSGTRESFAVRSDSAKRLPNLSSIFNVLHSRMSGGSVISSLPTT